MRNHILAVVATSLALTLASPAKNGPKDGIVLIIRHAEKPAEGQGLSRSGQARAEAYPRFFRKFKMDSEARGLDAIFAAADSEVSHRPRLTVEPLARAAKLRIDTRFDKKQADELVDAVRAMGTGKRVLVCWHHGQIPELLEAFRVKPESVLPDGEWPDGCFDWVIELRYDQDGRLFPHGAKRISEHLMPGDSE